jgi:predicted amidohydrolase YtcJ
MVMLGKKLFYIIALVMCLGCNKENADLLVYNGDIYTVDDDFSKTGAMVIRSGKILATGAADELRKLYNAADEKDLMGNAVYPGFIDPHCHFYGYGLTLRQADLVGSHSPQEIIARLKQHRDEYPSAWILGRGWDQNDWENKIFPDKKLLDNEFPDLPVYLVRVDGHAAWVNSKALELAGIQRSTRIGGGEVVYDGNGATGILLDNAMALVEKLIPPESRQDQVQAFLSAERNCFAVGLTGVGDAGLDRDIVMLIDSLHRSDMLTMRIYAMLNPNDDNMAQFISKGVYLTDRLSVRSIKLFADGALGSRGALLIQPYSDKPDTRGIQVAGPEYLTRICQVALDKGYQVNTHCIGDSAVRTVLGIYGNILTAGNDLRWRIEHSQVVHPADFVLYGRHGIIPSIQTTHATSDMYWAEERLGPERIPYAYAYRTLLEQNGWLPNGSDFPVESINPLYGFYAAVARKDMKGYPPEGYHMEESLSREQALKAMTIWAARSCFEEKNKGSLEPGKVADFVVLNRDIMKSAENEIPGTEVVLTVVDGKTVYSKKL